jgi:hypothetical protein
MTLLVERAKRLISLIGIIVLLGALMVGCGAVRQTMSFSECQPGKPDMSIGAFILAGIGGSVCLAPAPVRSQH